MSLIEIEPARSRTLVEIIDLAKRIRPLVFDEGALWEVAPHDHVRTSFNWAKSTLKTVRVPNLPEIARIKTLHEFGAPAFFKPSHAEVVAQIPDIHLEKTSAYAFVPNGDVRIVETYAALPIWGDSSPRRAVHEATVILYGDGKC